MEMGLKRYLALFFIFAGLGLVFLAGYTLLRNPDPGEKSELPASIAGLPLTSLSEGEQALTELAQMHGKEFPLVNGWIGTYGNRRQVTLWVAVSEDKAGSDRLLEAMRDKIAMDNSPLTPLGEQRDGNRSIYELNGMGQKHFYFQSGRLLVWLAANEEIAREAIQETLKFYPQD